MESIWWLFLFIILLIFEIITLGLTTIWFAGGAVCAFIVSLLGAGLEIEIAIFVLVSVALIFFTRPYAAKIINKDYKKTNADRLIGKTAKITEAIDNIEAKGAAMINGKEWTARAAADDIRISVGTYVRVKGIDGVKLIVEEIDDSESNL